MRILVLTMSDFGGKGGIAKYNRDLIRALASYPQTNEVVVLPRCVDASEGFVLPSKVIHHTAAAKSKKQYFHALRKLLFLRPKFDLVICGHVNLAMPAKFLASMHRAKTILLLYGVEAWRPAPQAWRNYFMRKMHYKFSISDFTKQHFTGWSKEAVQFLLPCSIEMNRYSPGEKDRAWMNKYGLLGKKLLLTFGRMDEAERYKGFDEVIDVMPELLKQHPDLLYVIAGDGTDRQRLERKVQRMGLEAEVIFTGYIPEDEKLAMYRSSDVFVMPGRGEGFGIVYLEARACGIPVIGSTLDASREALLDGKLGQCVNPDNPAELRESINFALKDHVREVPEALETFSLKRFCERTHRILDEINA